MKTMTDIKKPYSRRSFYIEDEAWYDFQSKLWANRDTASAWMRQQIIDYTYAEEARKDEDEPVTQ